MRNPRIGVQIPVTPFFILFFFSYFLATGYLYLKIEGAGLAIDDIAHNNYNFPQSQKMNKGL